MTKLKTILILITILILGFALRLYHNTDISLWHDEAFSALLIKYSWSEMMYRIGLDVHPPMYYVALRLWHYVLGDSLLALRGFSIFFGLGTAIAGYAFVKAAFKNNKAALITALLVAVNPFQIQYATEARMYTFGAFFSVLAAFLLVKALEGQKQHFETPLLSDKKYIYYYLGFAFSVAIIILTHYYLLFTAVALGGYALLYHFYYYRWNIRAYLSLSLSFVIVILSFLPWLKVFLFQYKQVGAGYWIPPMDRWSVPSTVWQMLISWDIHFDLPSIIQKYTHLSGQQFLWIMGTMFALTLILWFIRKATGPHKWLAVLAFLAPFGGAILFLLLAKLKGETSSVYLVRYFLFASTFYAILIAVWLTNIRWKGIQYVLLVLYVVSNIASFAHYWQKLDIDTKPGMNKAASFLEANVSAKDKLYVGSSFEFFNLKYYVSQMERSDVPQPLLYSGGQRTTENMPHFAGTAILTNQDLVPDFNEVTKPGDTVWLLWTNGFGGSKPETPSSWTQVDEQGFAEVRPYVGTWVIVTQYKVN